MIVKDGQRTGEYVAIQVKSGEKYRRSAGYAIPIEQHRLDWERSLIPVVGIVLDAKTRRLYWVNLTEALRDGDTSSWIKVRPESELSQCHHRQFYCQAPGLYRANGLTARVGPPRSSC